MPFKRHVEIGRVALVNFGPDVGKLVVITDVVDQNRALVDAEGSIRSVIGFKRLTLTDIKIDIPRLAKKKVLLAKLAEADVSAKFAATAWGKKVASRTAKASMTDFDRYSAMVAKAKKSRAVRKVFNQLKKAAK